MLSKRIEVEGYKPENYEYRKGLNISGEDVPSNAMVEAVIDLILSGFSDQSIKEIIVRSYHTNSYATAFIVNRAHKVLHTREEKQSENIFAKQLSRLFMLYRKCLEKGDERTALQTLAEINKISKLYTQKIEVSGEVYSLDFGFNTGKDETDKQND